MSKYAKRMAIMEKQASIVRTLFNTMSDPDIISFGGGAPAKEALPVNIVREITNDVMTYDKRGIESLQYGNVMGLTDLREVIISDLLPKELNVDIENIMITNGGLEGINLFCQLFIEPEDVI